MIFAAGLGTRMGELTRDRPKPLIEVCGRPLITHALDIARDAGAARIVVNIHAHAGQMTGWLAEHAPGVVVSRETERLETGGGLKRAQGALGGGPVFTLNADMVWRGDNPLAALARNWEPARMGALLCLVPRARATGHDGPGDFERDACGRLIRRGAAARAEFVYAGAQIIDLAALDGIEAEVFSLNAVWDRLLEAGRLFGTVWQGDWVDVGRPEGIALAEAALAS